MAYKVIVKKRFTNKVVKLLNYLEKEWNETVAQDFSKKLDKQLERISLQPLSGIGIKNFKNVRSVLVTKHSRLYYRIKEDTIEIVNMYDTRMNPKRNPYKLK